ncbi:MAG TPA: hypothetical protein VFJ89_13185 [Nocardioides sp.]|jgi:hypothetical protein|nr:hypothetical protein [Nocardioides sp.]
MTSVPERVDVAGRRLTCQVCEGDTFAHRTTKLITSGIANSGFNQQADAAVCLGCGYVHTFLGAHLTWTRLD